MADPAVEVGAARIDPQNEKEPGAAGLFSIGVGMGVGQPMKRRQTSELVSPPPMTPFAMGTKPNDLIAAAISAV
jgi:hypothetical protein